MELFLLPLVIVRMAEVQVNDCGSDAAPQTGSTRPDPPALSQSRIHLKISLVVVASERG